MTVRSGKIILKIDGTRRFIASDNIDYNLGADKREALIGPDSIPGFKVMPQVAFFEGEIRDDSDLALDDLLNLESSTLTLELSNGKNISMPNAFFASEGNIGTNEANVAFRFEAESAFEISS